jgi:thymidylate kinase
LRDHLPSLSPLERIYWFAAERATLLAEAQRSSNARVVVYDRYVETARAFRWAEVRLGWAPEDLLGLVEVVNRVFPPADLVLYLDLDLADVRGRGRYDDPRLPFALAHYRRKAMSDPRYVTLDATRSPDEVLELARGAILAVIAEG